MQQRIRPEVQPGSAPSVRHRPRPLARQAARTAGWLAVPVLLAACSGGGPTGSAGTGGTTVPAGASNKALSLPVACIDLKGILQTSARSATPLARARAQLVPLTEVRTNNAALLTALRSLVTADHELIASGGRSATAGAQIANATQALTTVCPGAAA